MVLHNGKERLTIEEKRLAQDRKKERYWKKFGPYLSERQWSTVREDYSANGDAWSYFPFEHSRSRAYRWGEDGIAGISDTHQYQCISFAFWNEKDDILKERLFGLAGPQGNHGEDVKEIYYYLDNVPSHSYMKYLYKYPQKKFPYEKLVDENGKRSREDLEYEISDTGIFQDNRYFDIFIETAKDEDNEEEILFRVTAFNRGPEPAPLHIVPQFYFRNTWDWGVDDDDHGKPIMKVEDNNNNQDGIIKSNHWYLGDRYLHLATSPGFETAPDDVEPELLFCENSTNTRRLYNNNDGSDFAKDAFHDYIIEENKQAVNPEKFGTKSCAWYAFDKADGILPGDFVTVRFKFSNNKPTTGDLDEQKFDKIIDKRQKEADDFYYKISPLPVSDELRDVQRQALAGMLWSKQYYHFVHYYWLKGDPGAKIAPPPERANVRNIGWGHLHCDDVLSLPDVWEYPFFASWDTAFHCLPLAMVDPDFAKRQLDLLTREWYMHPNGQIPAYEWNFSDVNPPVHAWAAFRTFKIERKMYGREDLDFLERVFQKLLLNFTWWVNRKDEQGKNVFEGGFLGLDNIGLFNRSEPLPTGGTLEQADSTGWMAFFCLQMLNIALELSKTRPVYEDIASKFFEHFLFISDAMTFRCEGVEKPLWNDEDGFYYDAISWGGPWSQQLPVRSLVGLIPLYACLTLEPQILNKFPSFAKRVKWFIENRRDLSERNIASMDARGVGERMLLALVDENRLKKLLERMLDEDEFLSEYGIRSMSKHHKENPYSMDVNGQNFCVGYVPGESNSGLFGGNSNWRGPIWFPTTFLLVESLQRFYMFYGENFTVECPKGSGEYKNLAEVAEEIQHRLINIFKRDESTGRRAYNGGDDMFDYDEHFKDYVRFHEYFHGDTGRGMGSEHQLGWTGLVAKLIHDTGVTISLPKTPKTPVATAEHYFDDVIKTPGSKGKHQRRPSSRIKLGRRYSVRSGYSTSGEMNEGDDYWTAKGDDHGGDDGKPEEDSGSEDNDVVEHIRNQLERHLSMKGKENEEELETTVGK